MNFAAPAALGRPGVGSHVRDTVWIAAPLALAHLAQLAMATTDTLMLGRIGPAALAAGSFGGGLFFTALFVLQGLLAGVGVQAARALGAGDPAKVPGVYWTGAVLAAVLALPLFAGATWPAPFLRLTGEPPALIADVVAYLHVLRWGAPAGVMGIGLMRVFLPAAGLERALMWVVPSAVGLNLLLNWVLIWGVHWGGVSVPAFGMRGSAGATAISLWAVTLALLGLLHGRPSWRRMVVLHRPGIGTLRSLLAIGLPVGATVLVEVTMFLSTSFFAGAMGDTVLAAHMIGFSVASISFIIPFAISQAANVRVAALFGAGRPDEARRAGIAAIGLTACVMAVVAVGLVVASRRVAGLYVVTDTAGGAATIAIAVSLLRIAAMFQVADGVQTVAAGALRGMRDTRVPMLIATIGYWLIGLPAAWLLGIRAAWGVQGLWWGLFLGLVAAAVGLTCRFIWRSRLPLMT